jgi:hypothetical protein
MTSRRLLTAVLLAALLAAGCSSSAPSSGGEPKPLQGNRIPKGAGPHNK